jgi:hypothetical protein
MLLLKILASEANYIMLLLKQAYKGFIQKNDNPLCAGLKNLMPQGDI